MNKLNKQAKINAYLKIKERQKMIKEYNEQLEKDKNFKECISKFFKKVFRIISFSFIGFIIVLSILLYLTGC